MRLDSAEFAVTFRELNRADAQLLEEVRHIGPGFGDQMVRKEIAVPVNHSQAGLLVGSAVHILLETPAEVAASRVRPIEQSLLGDKQAVSATVFHRAILAGLLAVFEESCLAGIPQFTYE